MQTNRFAIEKYILAKDGNRPDLLRQAFTAQATVKMVVLTNAISFPADLEGKAAIADTLVSGFSQTYENIYTFCLSQPPEVGALTHSCKWLVGMSVKGTGEVRVGCGQYHWQFDPQTWLATQLTITIEHMQFSPASTLEPVMDWLQGLSYPWCRAGDVILHAPQVGSLAPVVEYFEGL